MQNSPFQPGGASQPDNLRKAENNKKGIYQLMNGIFDYVLVGLAAVAAGAVNAIAGGGTLITFPTLVALGVSSVMANVTNTVALSPGYFGGTLAQKNDLRGQKARLWIVIPAGIVGGVLGGFLL